MNGSSLIQRATAIANEPKSGKEEKEKTMYLSPRSFINNPSQPLSAAHTGAGQRGYQPIYHLDIVNRCPGCGKSHWHIGRFSAECAHCETALPLAMVSSQPMQPRFTERFSKTAMAA